MRLVPRSCLILTVAALAGCGAGSDADYPHLVPQAQIIGPEITAAPLPEGLIARAAALRARAATLRGAVIPAGSIPSTDDLDAAALELRARAEALQAERDAALNGTQ